MDPFILENIVSVLAPYRRQAHQMIKLSLYLSATSLLSKSPLPHDAVTIEEHLQDFIEDAVLISSRIAATEQGAIEVKKGKCPNSSRYLHTSFTLFTLYYLREI